MKKIVSVLSLFFAATLFGDTHSFGFGLSLWQTVSELPAGIDTEGAAPFVTYQYLPGGLLKFEIDLNYYANGYDGSTKPTITPIALVLLGGSVYGGVGVGTSISNGFVGNKVSSIFYVARLGIQFEILPKIYLDIHGNYRNGTFSELDRASADTVTIGVALRGRL